MLRPCRPSATFPCPAGDVLAVLPQTPSSSVDELLHRLQLDGSQVVQVMRNATVTYYVSALSLAFKTPGIDSSVQDESG